MDHDDTPNDEVQSEQLERPVATSPRVSRLRRQRKGPNTPSDDETPNTKAGTSSWVKKTEDSISRRSRQQKVDDTSFDLPLSDDTVPKASMSFKKTNTPSDDKTRKTKAGTSSKKPEDSISRGSRKQKMPSNDASSDLPLNDDAIPEAYMSFKKTNTPSDDKTLETEVGTSSKKPEDSICRGSRKQKKDDPSSDHPLSDDTVPKASVSFKKTNTPSDDETPKPEAGTSSKKPEDSISNGSRKQKMRDTSSDLPLKDDTIPEASMSFKKTNTPSDDKNT